MLWLALHLPQLSLEAFCATLALDRASAGPESLREQAQRLVQVPADPLQHAAAPLPAARPQPLQAMCSGRLAAIERPVALVADHRIHSVNPAAAACGVQPGIKRATALALAADLLLAEADAARDAAALRAVAHAALACTPAVTLQGGQTVLLEVEASLRLFGGLERLCRQLLTTLAPLGHHIQTAAAPTAVGAALLAQWPPEHPSHPASVSSTSSTSSRLSTPITPSPSSPSSASSTSGLSSPSSTSNPSSPRRRAASTVDLVLGPHATQLPALQALLDAAPVWLLGPGREHWEALQGMGLQTLCDLRQLPRSGVARRFGAGLLEELDRARGLLADPRRWSTLPDTFDSRLELYARAENTDQVLHGAGVLLARLAAWAQGRHARIGACTLRMLHERHRQTVVPPTELRIELAEPSLDAAHLQLLLRERLGRVVLAAPTLELRLHCSHLVAGHAPNGELFPTRTSAAEGLTRLLERLRARLGDEQVLRLVPVEDHRPERASRAVPAHDAAGMVRVPAAAALARAAAGPCPGLPLHRPVWLLPDPLPLAERDMLPLLEGRPLQLLSGPERIETGWWDGATMARDYYIAQTMDGSLVWVYRGRLAQVPGEVNWYLQGRFA